MQGCSRRNCPIAHHAARVDNSARSRAIDFST
jgi:hypothetical protein